MIGFLPLSLILISFTPSFRDSTNDGAMSWKKRDGGPLTLVSIDDGEMSGFEQEYLYTLYIVDEES